MSIAVETNVAGKLFIVLVDVTFVDYSNLQAYSTCRYSSTRTDLDVGSYRLPIE